MDQTLEQPEVPTDSLDADFEIRQLSRDELEYAAMLCARAFRDNPTTLVAVGDDPVKRLRFMYRMFSDCFPCLRQTPVGAWMGRQLVGIVGLHDSGDCIVGRPRNFAYTLPRSPRWGSFRGTRMISRAVLQRDKFDMKNPHLHLEPFAVDPLVQDKRVGRALMHHIVDRSEREGIPLFGIADKMSNIPLAANYGFKPVGTVDIIGIPHEKMLREVTGASSSVDERPKESGPTKSGSG